MYNISTHFKILAFRIESIDEIFSQAMETTNECSIEKETLNMYSIPKAHFLDDKIFSLILPEEVMSSGRGVQHESGRNQLTDLRDASQFSTRMVTST